MTDITELSAFFALYNFDARVGGQRFAARGTHRRLAVHGGGVVHSLFLYLSPSLSLSVGKRDIRALGVDRAPNTAQVTPLLDAEQQTVNISLLY